MRCNRCHERTPHASEAYTNASSTHAPPLLWLELPDDAPPSTHYALKPDEHRTLFAPDGAVSQYVLVGVLFYRRDYHFFADVCDPSERRWLRYDGMVADGVGQPTPPPGGATQQAGARYYPTALVYVKHTA